MVEELLIICNILNSLVPNLLSNCTLQCNTLGISCDDGDHVTGVNLGLDKGWGWGDYRRTSVGSIPSELGTLLHLEELSVEGGSIGGSKPVKIGGSIPSELGKLRKLKIFDAMENELTGGLPTEIADLQALTELRVWYNRLDGIVPVEYGKIRSLRYLALTENFIGGTLPSELGNVRPLTHLLMENLRFQGTIPSEFGNLDSLQCLNLIGSRSELDDTFPHEHGELIHTRGMNGSLPTEIGRLESLQGLSLTRQMLQGSIATEIGKLTRVRKFVLDHNSLTGTIPTEVGSFTNGSTWNCGFNSLHGTIPSEFANAQEVMYLVLGRNQLEGSIPTEILGLQRMRSFQLGNNSISGTIGTELNMVELNFMQIQYNSLSGSIPTQLGRSSSMMQLRLEYNKFRNVIPSELSKLNRCSYVSIAENSLTGSIPREYGRLQNLISLHLLRNRLWGSIPSELGKGNILRMYLAHNSLSGSVPRGFRKAESLVLHNNLFTGRMFPWGGVRFSTLTIHENRMGGSVPVFPFAPIEIHKAYGFLRKTPIMLTMHGNHLSCVLPDFNMSHTVFHRTSTLLGNFFTGPMPAWVPLSERDPILYANPRAILYRFMGPLLGMSLLACTSKWMLKVPSFMNVIRTQTRRMVFLSGRYTPPCTHYSGLVRACLKLSLLPVCAILPLYLFGPAFYQCPRGWPNFGHLKSNFTSEWLIGCGLLLHYGAVYVFLKPLTIGRTSVSCFSESRRRLLWKFTCWLGWGIIITLLSIPSTTHALTASLPKENVVASFLGENTFLIIHFSSAMLGALLMNVGMPTIAKVYGHWCNLDPVPLALWCRVFAVQGIPATAVFVMHESCIGLWKKLWSICNPDNPDHSRFDMVVESGFYVALTTPEMCAASCLHEVAWNGMCGRAVVRILASIFEQSLIVEMATPYFFLWGWFSQSLVAAGNSTLIVRLVARMQELVQVWPRPFTQAIQLSTWLQLSITWGPLIPTLQPLLLLCLATCVFIYQVGVNWFHISVLQDEPETAKDGTKFPLAPMAILGFFTTVGIVTNSGFRCALPWMVATCVLCSVLRLVDPSFDRWPSTSAQWSIRPELEMVCISRGGQKNVSKDSRRIESKTAEAEIWHPT